MAPEPTADPPEPEQCAPSAFELALRKAIDPDPGPTDPEDTP